MKRFLLLSAIFLLGFASFAKVKAEEPPVPNEATCKARIDHELAREQRLYRYALFGRSKAEDAGIGEVWFDTEGIAWYKAAKNKWVSLTHPGLEWTNITMEKQAEIDTIPTDKGGMNFPRPGFFDTKRVLTSDLIPHVEQGTRSLQCRVNTLCAAVRAMMQLSSTDGAIPVTGTADGCLEREMSSMMECQFALTKNQVDNALAFTHCEDVGEQLIEREIALLKLLFEYDASYRSLLQFAGFFDTFLEDLRWTVVGNIRQAASIIGWLHRIPCFTSSCDEYPPQLLREDRPEELNTNISSQSSPSS
ncbi:hypothetical protein COU80_01030 [Candidatus Peregrinibacteria bacterium CG10_big_fil_rev_8_21_14_0_10_55_24]|nr:MAG: hypothetical protein COU80_01030 [Candidatus Peregrinibacteria bacterium CG10_big_fil_rev_8_21_14_0_10_55_24]